jgi:hypothetical protein
MKTEITLDRQTNTAERAAITLANHADFREIQAAAVTLGATLTSFEVTQPGDFDAAFKEASTLRSGVTVLKNGEATG